MKKKELKGTKPALKNSSANKKTGPSAGKNKKPGTKELKAGRGGARPGAGRKKTKGDFQQLHIDMPLPIIEAMEKMKINNKTSFIIKTIARNIFESDKYNSFSKILKKKVLESVEPV